MYKNFKITEEERQQILESHMSHGYKKPLNEEEVGFKEGPGENQTPELDHFNKLVKPQLLNSGFKLSDEKFMAPYGSRFSLVYGNHNTGVNVLYFQPKGKAWSYKVWSGNNKNYKEFPLGGANDIKKIANNVIKYALSLTGKTLNEDSTQDTEEENYSEHPLWNDLTNTYDGPIGVRTVIYRIIELSKEGKYSEDDILDIGIKAIELMQKESHNGVYYGGGSEPMGY